MIKALKNKYALSNQGAKDLLKGIIYSVLANISLMFPVILLAIVLNQLLAPILGMNAPEISAIVYTVIGIVILAVVFIFHYDLKTEKFQKDTAIFLPSREDSYERLLEKDKQFAASGQPVEEQAVSSVWLEELLQHLSSDERIILHKLYFEDKSERIVSMELGISKTALHQRKVKLLQKLKNFLENMGKA